MAFINTKVRSPIKMSKTAVEHYLEAKNIAHQSYRLKRSS